MEKEVENVLICEELVTHWGKGRRSFIAGSSTSNQRIERLWRDVFRFVCHFLYFPFMPWNSQEFWMSRTSSIYFHYI